MPIDVYQHRSTAILRRAIGAIAFVIACVVSNGTYAQQDTFYRVASIANDHSNPNAQKFFARMESDFQQMQMAAGTNAALYVSPANVVNAFATVANGGHVVVIYDGLIKAFRGDRDAINAVLAHELGHVRHNHVQQGAQAKSAIRLLTSLAGLAIDINQSRHGHAERAGIGQAAGDLGFTVASKAYTRDQEREADRASVEILVASDFDPEGAIKAQRYLLAKGGSTSLLIFASHPSSQERLENLTTQVAALRTGYDNRKTIAQQQEAERVAKQKEAQATAAAQSQNDATARAALLEESSRGLREKAVSAKAQEAIVFSQTGSARPSVAISTLQDVAPSNCKDQSTTRRICITTASNGQSVVQRCSKIGEQWQCQTQ